MALRWAHISDHEIAFESSVRSASTGSSTTRPAAADGVTRDRDETPLPGDVRRLCSPPGWWRRTTKIGSVPWPVFERPWPFTGPNTRPGGQAASLTGSDTCYAARGGRIRDRTARRKPRECFDRKPLGCSPSSGTPPEPPRVSLARLPAFWDGDFDRAELLAEQVVQECAEAVGLTTSRLVKHCATSRSSLTSTWRRPRRPRFLQDAVALYRHLDHPRLLAETLVDLGRPRK